MQKDIKLDNELARVELCLMDYLLHLKGFSSRAISDLNSNLPSHTTISGQINVGEEYFRRILPLIEEIKDCLIENKVKNGEFKLNLNDKEISDALNLFKDNFRLQKEYPKLFFPVLKVKI